MNKMHAIQVLIWFMYSIYSLNQDFYFMNCPQYGKKLMVVQNNIYISYYLFDECVIIFIWGHNG